MGRLQVGLRTSFIFFYGVLCVAPDSSNPKWRLLPSQLFRDVSKSLREATVGKPLGLAHAYADRCHCPAFGAPVWALPIPFNLLSLGLDWKYSDCRLFGCIPDLLGCCRIKRSEEAGCAASSTLMQRKVSPVQERVVTERGVLLLRSRT